MARFDEHLEQAKRNYLFLEKINKIDGCHDWQVTVSFYTALHLINAHLSKFDLQYRKHSDVNDAINPVKPLAIAQIPEQEYISYNKLQTLSRRSRYLVNDNPRDINNERVFLTYDKHLAKALRHLDKLIHYFVSKYGIDFPSITINCPSFGSQRDMHHIKTETPRPKIALKK